MRWLSEIIAYLTVERCIYCGARRDRPPPVCQGLKSVGFYHIWRK